MSNLLTTTDYNIMDSFQFLNAYDKRTSVGTVSASDVHQMVRESKKKLGISTNKPRAPKARSIDEIRDRAVMMGVTLEMQGKTIYLTPSGTSEYYTTNKAKAWQVLDQISADIVAAMSDDQVFAQAESAKALIF